MELTLSKDTSSYITLIICFIVGFYLYYLKFQKHYHWQHYKISNVHQYTLIHVWEYLGIYIYGDVEKRIHFKLFEN